MKRGAALGLGQDKPGSGVAPPPEGAAEAWGAAFAASFMQIAALLAAAVGPHRPPAEGGGEAP
eukprot:5840739-Pyramimonas_sp.AAC.1